MWILLISEGSCYARVATKSLFSREPKQWCPYGAYLLDATSNLPIKYLEINCEHWHLYYHCKTEVTSSRCLFIGIICSIWTMVSITHSRYRTICYTSVKWTIIVVNLHAIQQFHIRVYLDERLDTKLQHLSKGCVYDCICSTPWGYY